MKPKVLIRTDGNSQIGLGHLVRCSALAHMLKDKFSVTFFCMDIPFSLKKEFNECGFLCNIIGNESEFLSMLTTRTIVVLDGYHFDINYQKQIKATGSKLVCIDDLHEKEFVADLIINHAPGVKPSDYKAPVFAKFALGLEHALLRPAFLEQSKRNHKHKKLGSIFICFGGADPSDITNKVLVEVVGFLEFKKIIVVIGAAYEHFERLKKLIEDDERIEVYRGVNENQMVALMREADLAIVPASGILYEVLTISIPVITGKYIENQANFIKELTKHDHVINGGEFTSEEIRRSLKLVLRKRNNFKRLFDGNSGKRILDLFMNQFGDIFIITGANRGLGNSLTTLLARRENTSIISISREITDAQKLQILSGKFFFIKQDLSKKIRSNTLSRLSKIITNNRRIVFINNAFTIEPIDKISNLNYAEIERALKINIYSPIVLIKYLVEEFSDFEIDFINISSGAAHKSISNWSIYSSSKAFIHRFFEILKEENKDNKKFRFYSIDPGIIDTDMQKKIRSSDFPLRHVFVNAEKEGKLSSPIDVAKIVLNVID